MTRADWQDESDHPTARSVRYWLGLMLGLMFVVQVGAALWAYSDWSHMRPDHPDEMRVYWHRYAVTLLNLALAMVFIIGGAGLILNFDWAWSVIAAAAVIEILITIVTQVWEASLMVPAGYPPGRGLLGAVIGILAWSIVPVGIWVLGTAGRPRNPAFPANRLGMHHQGGSATDHSVGVRL